MAAALGWCSSQAQTFTLKSNDLGGQFNQSQYANSFGCNGGNVSPELHWENAPKETRAFAITIYDKDAPTGSGFWHWMVVNIPASTSAISTNAGSLQANLLPSGSITINNDAGQACYIGPCPPAGSSHQYVITVYALKAPIAYSAGTSSAVVGFMINNSCLARASLVAYAQQ